MWKVVLFASKRFCGLYKAREGDRVGINCNFKQHVMISRFLALISSADYRNELDKNMSYFNYFINTESAHFCRPATSGRKE